MIGCRAVARPAAAAIVNPITHQGQIEGGLIQAVGQAMSERTVLKDGAAITAHLGDDKPPTIMDIPDLETVLLPVAAARHRSRPPRSAR